MMRDRPLQVARAHGLSREVTVCGARIEVGRVDVGVVVWSEGRRPGCLRFVQISVFIALETEETGALIS